MRKFIATQLLIITLLCSLVSPAWADGPAPPVLITEVQTGAGTASDEFVELYNRSDGPADISGWQLRTINPGAEPVVLVTVADGSVVAAHSYFVLYTASLAPANLTGQSYAAGLAKTDKTLALYAAERTTCQLAVQDAVAWRSGTGTMAGEGNPVAVPADKASKEKLLQRARDDNGIYIDSDDNAADFVLSAATANPATPGVALGATPGADNLQTATVPTAAGSASTLPPLSIPGCVVPTEPDPTPDPDPAPVPPADQPPEDPADPGEDPAVSPNAGLAAPQISELLPNPAAPQTDDHDEFIELYNPNGQSFDLSGYALEAGLTTTHRYAFPAGTYLAPGSYVAFFSLTTGLSLSNSGSQVRLLDAAGQPLSQSDAYGQAKDGQAWALAGSAWQWTTLPTPNAANQIQAPAATKAASTAKTTASKTSKPTTVKTAKVTVPKPKTKAAKTAKTAKPAKVETVAAISPDKGSLHTGVLAAAALFAILYGAYEYRRDLANKIHQFRADRAARRAAGQKPARRRSR